MTKIARLAAALSIVQLLAGCGSVPAPMPSAPSPVAPSAPVTPAPSPSFAPSVTLSGFVSEIVQGAPVPVEGAGVYCEPCGEGTHTWAYSDSKGFYAFTGIWGNNFSIWVGKDGYQDPPGAVNSGSPHGAGWRDVRISGDTRLDIQLVRK
jgi:hypothetical protein